MYMYINGMFSWLTSRSKFLPPYYECYIHSFYRLYYTAKLLTTNYLTSYFSLLFRGNLLRMESKRQAVCLAVVIHMLFY